MVHITIYGIHTYSFQESVETTPKIDMKYDSAGEQYGGISIIRAANEIVKTPTQPQLNLT